MADNFTKIAKEAAEDPWDWLRDNEEEIYNFPTEKEDGTPYTELEMWKMLFAVSYELEKGIHVFKLLVNAAARKFPAERFQELARDVNTTCDNNVAEIQRKFDEEFPKLCEIIEKELAPEVELELKERQRKQEREQELKG